MLNPQAHESCWISPPLLFSTSCSLQSRIYPGSNPSVGLLHHLSMPSLHYHLPGQPQHSMVAPQHQPYSIIYSSHDIFGGFLQCKSEDVSSFCLIQFSRHIWGANSDGGTSFHSLRMQPWLYIIFSVCPHESTPPRDTWLAGTDSSSSCLSRPFPRSLLGTW